MTTNDNDRDERFQISRLGPPALLLLAGFFAFKAITGGGTGEPQQEVSTQAARAKAEENFKKIQDVRVGDRAAPVKNPTGEFDDSLGREVDPATWRKLELRAEKRDGTYCDIELLRPNWWIEERAAKTGGSVYISVPECGIDGNAEVLSISACPPIQLGTGPVVIGTFAHESAQVINVHVEGLDEPVGVTTNHPIWSATRQDFIPAGALLPGERLHGIHNNPRITSISPRGPPEPVYNVEVLGEHVYEVSTAGLLVHNTGPQWCFTNGTTNNPVQLSAPKGAAALRNAPGAVVGGQNISRVTATGTWFRGTHGSFAKVPGQVADALRGRTFKSFDDFRSAFWKATANDADLAAHFSKANITRMKKGLAPIAAKAQHHGEIRSFILHHRTPIHAGGGVYNLDNLLIVSPKYHQSILDPAFHFGR